MATVADIIALLVAATQAASVYAPIVQAAQAAGQANLTDAQWATILVLDDSSEAKLAADVKAALADGK
jgi:hypothetical protein